MACIFEEKGFCTYHDVYCQQNPVTYPDYSDDIADLMEKAPLTTCRGTEKLVMKQAKKRL